MTKCQWNANNVQQLFGIKTHCCKNEFLLLCNKKRLFNCLNNKCWYQIAQIFRPLSLIAHVHQCSANHCLLFSTQKKLLMQAIYVNINISDPVDFYFHHPWLVVNKRQSSLPSQNWETSATRKMFSDSFFEVFVDERLRSAHFLSESTLSQMQK